MSTPRTLVAIAAGATMTMFMTACSGGHAGTNGTIFGTGTTAATTTTVVPTTTESPTTTAAPTTTTTSTSTTTTSTTQPPPTTEAPTTTTAPPGARVPLRFDGLGDVRFGVDPDNVLAYLTAAFGTATADTNWVSASDLGCPGTEARTVFFDDLKITFGDDSDVSTGRRHFFTWSFGPPAGSAPRPAAMATLLGVTIGSSVATIMDKYPAADLIVGDSTHDDSAQLSEGLSVVLTSTTRGGAVTKLIGGTPCTK